MQNFPFISVIIPVLNEAQQLTSLVRALAPWQTELEFIIVDGGSTDHTVRLAQAQPWLNVISFGRASRALQMNAGAQAARGEILLFLHADVRLPIDAAKAMQQALLEAQCVGGCFAFSFPATVPRAWRIYSWGINLRTRWFQTATGDQAIFARRKVFEQVGGYRDMPLMEDIELFNAMKRFGRVATLAQAVEVSPRRWQQYGLLRTGLLMYVLRFGYWLGFAPATLKRFFLDVR